MRVMALYHPVYSTVAAISETMEIIEEQDITYAVFYTADSSDDDTSKVC